MMHALSLHQPWACLIALGYKRVETRSWACGLLATGPDGGLAIHAAKRWGPAERQRARVLVEALRAHITVPPVHEHLLLHAPPLGAVVALARIAAIGRTDDLTPSPLEALCGDYTAGRYGWVLEQVRPLAIPLPLKGHRSLWVLSAGEAREVRDRCGDLGRIQAEAGGGA